MYVTRLNIEDIITDLKATSSSSNKQNSELLLEYLEQLFIDASYPRREDQNDLHPNSNPSLKYHKTDQCERLQNHKGLLVLDINRKALFENAGINLGECHTCLGALNGDLTNMFG